MDGGAIFGVTCQSFQCLNALFSLKASDTDPSISAVRTRFPNSVIFPSRTKERNSLFLNRWIRAAKAKSARTSWASLTGLSLLYALAMALQKRLGKSASASNDVLSTAGELEKIEPLLQIRDRKVRRYLASMSFPYSCISVDWKSSPSRESSMLMSMTSCPQVRVSSPKSMPVAFCELEQETRTRARLSCAYLQCTRSRASDPPAKETLGV